MFIDFLKIISMLVPTPTLLVIFNLASCLSAICLTIAKPKPVPSIFSILLLGTL